MPTNQWTHVAVTLQGGTSGKLFVNGSLVASNAITVRPISIHPTLNYLGKSQWPDPLFNGRLDEVYAYNYALSDTEISRLANNVPPPPSEPTTLITTVAGGALNISWPLNYLGCRLESNSVGITANDAWFTVSNSAATNAIHLPIDLNQAKVFFRLSYP